VLLALAGCAAEPGRAAGPGALVAGVGGGLVNAHDALARKLFGDAAGPMLIAPPPPPSTATGEDGPRAVTASATVTRHQMASAQAGWLTAADSTSPDLDGDGTVSVDEVVALGRSGLSDPELAERLERTGRTFDLSTSQEQYLRVRGIGDDLIARLRTLNRSVLPPRPDVATVRMGDASDAK